MDELRAAIGEVIDVNGNAVAHGTVAGEARRVLHGLHAIVIDGEQIIALPEPLTLRRFVRTDDEPQSRCMVHVIPFPFPIGLADSRKNGCARSRGWIAMP